MDKRQFFKLVEVPVERNGSVSGCCFPINGLVRIEFTNVAVRHNCVVSSVVELFRIRQRERAGFSEGIYFAVKPVALRLVVAQRVPHHPRQAVPLHTARAVGSVSFFVRADYMCVGSNAVTYHQYFDVLIHQCQLVSECEWCSVRKGIHRLDFIKDNDIVADCLFECCESFFCFKW